MNLQSNTYQLLPLLQLKKCDFTGSLKIALVHEQHKQVQLIYAQFMQALLELPWWERFYSFNRTNSFREPISNKWGHIIGLGWDRLYTKPSSQHNFYDCLYLLAGRKQLQWLIFMNFLFVWVFHINYDIIWFINLLVGAFSLHGFQDQS